MDNLDDLRCLIEVSIFGQNGEQESRLRIRRV